MRVRTKRKEERRLTTVAFGGVAFVSATAVMVAANIVVMVVVAAAAAADAVGGSWSWSWSSSLPFSFSFSTFGRTHGVSSNVVAAFAPRAPPLSQGSRAFAALSLSSPLPSPVSSSRSSLSSPSSSSRLFAGGFDNDDGGSGVFYDADPSAMDAAYAAAQERGTTETSARTRTRPTNKNRKGRARSANVASSSSSSSSSSVSLLPRDVLIIGSGLAGLSTAFHLLTHTDHHVTLLEREDPLPGNGGQMSKTTAGSFAAAGMLAPQSERLPSGPLLDLCLESRDMYPSFVSDVEDYARKSGEDGWKYLWRDGNDDDGHAAGQNNNAAANFPYSAVDDDSAPWKVGYRHTGGFLAPAFAGDSVATWSPPPATSASTCAPPQWLDSVQVRELEPLLHPDVVGGWWFPEDASVDARRMTCSLRAACVGLGAQFMHGAGCEALGLELSEGRCKGVRLADGRTLAAKSVVLANGSWMRDLLPVPVVPHKGQSLSLRMPSSPSKGKGRNGRVPSSASSPPLLSRVLFAQDTYIVPKADGRIVVGATVEAGSYDPSVTPSGIMHVLAGACRLVPALADLPIEETWAGLRPTTPDKGPILGRAGNFENLYCAGGYWRNGVLLAPKTGQLLGDLIARDRSVPTDDGYHDDGSFSRLTKEDEALLSAFSWDRFTALGMGNKLAADARYAASMHPVHKYSTGLGVSAAVGTELGFYSEAGAAKAERARDRAAMFSSDGDGFNNAGEEDAFERAARMGKADGTAFTLGDDALMRRVVVEGDGDDDASWGGVITPRGHFSNSSPTENDEELSAEGVADHAPGGEPFNGAPDAFTVGSYSSDEDGGYDDGKGKGKDGALLYDDAYKTGGSARTVVQANGRGGSSMVPAEKAPDFAERLIEEERELVDSFARASDTGGKTSYDETTYDGYQTILQSNWGSSEADVREKMRQARLSNRAKASTIDESKIGALRMPDDDAFAITLGLAQASGGGKDKTLATSEGASEKDTLTSVYDRIAANKAASASFSSSSSLAADVPSSEDRPDPGFRIYHVNSKTGERREIPPFTRPEAFAKLVEEEEGGGPAVPVDPSYPSSSSSSESVEASDASQVIPPIIDGESRDRENEKNEYDETTFDGYQTIFESNWGSSEDDLRESMRRSRVANRMKTSEIDETKIGAMPMPDPGPEPAVEEMSTSPSPDLSMLYEGIISNKKAAKESGVGMGGESSSSSSLSSSHPEESRPDPGFRIYHVDSETGEKREIPPYTKPQEFFAAVEEEKKNLSGTKGNAYETSGS